MLILQPARSVMLALAIAAACLAAAMAFLLAGDGWLAWMFAPCLLAAWPGIRRTRPDPDACWCFRPDGSVLYQRSGHEALIRVAGSTTLFGGVVWLHWQPLAGGERLAPAIWLIDQFSADDWRRLQVWLRHTAALQQAAT